MNTQIQQSIAPIRFRFEHLGPVREAELELGDLTIITGRNNTGKTYIAYTIYGFLKHYLLGTRRRMHSQSKFSRWIETLASLSTTHEHKHWLSLDDILSHRREILSEYSNFFSDVLLADVFSSRREEFEASRVSMNLPQLPSQVIKNMKNLSHELQRDDPSYPFCFDGSYLCLSPQTPLQVGIDTHEELVDKYRRLIVPELSFDISIISAERFGISLFYKELDFTNNQITEALQGLQDREYSSDDILYSISDRASNRYALPIIDNIRFTRGIAQIRTGEGELQSGKLFGRIEQLLDGSFLASDNQLRFRSNPHQESRSQGSGFDIPLHLASASARGLSDLYFFLKHQASHNHLLFIDEPESHLDTGNQVQLARMLARFVRAGMRILVTTHSDYILKEINNLIMLSSDFKDKERVKKSLGYAKDDFLDPSMIRAYTAENGGLSLCKIDSRGIDYPLFDQVIDAINRASIELSTRVEE